MAGTEPAQGGEAAIFLLSFRQRDELAGVLASAGWRVIAARRADAVERRWLASGAAVAIVDARGALDDGLAATRALSGPVAAHGGALLVLLSRGKSERLGDFLAAGATQFLTSPMHEPELLHAVRFAEAQALRVSGDWSQVPEAAGDALGWRYDPGAASLHLTTALAGLLALSERTSPRAALRTLGPDDRQSAYAALRRLRGGDVTTAFAHAVPGVGRVVEHLQRDPRTARIHALVEPLGVAPDAGAAVRDALTGARDAASARRWIDRRLHADGGPVSVILIGLSRFAVVNTAYGKPAGDALLRAVFRRVEDVARTALGREAFVARLGGSDFVIAGDGDAERVELAALQVQDALARPFLTDRGTAPLGADVVVTASVAGDDATSLLHRASEALVRARDRRANAPAGAAVPQQSLDRLATDLRQALERGEIETLFQPQVAIASGAIGGVEALARWQHPALGEIGAETLFAAAGRAGLGVALSDHVQAVALHTAAAWPAALGALRVSVNITADDIARPGFADLLLDRIDASGFPRSRLTLEVTESGLIEELGAASRLLASLRTAGCRVAIDDFGTGYSSLAYLKALPLDYLKIDKQLSQDITGTPRDRIVVRGVIDMARSLGLSVIAEGVETDDQLELLAKEGCQYFQGFLCAEPLATDALLALVDGRQATWS